MCEDDIGDLGLSGGHHPGPLPAAHHPRQPLVPAHTVDTFYSILRHYLATINSIRKGFHLFFTAVSGQESGWFGKEGCRSTLKFSLNLFFYENCCKTVSKSDC